MSDLGGRHGFLPFPRPLTMASHDLASILGKVMISKILNLDIFKNMLWSRRYHQNRPV